MKNHILIALFIAFTSFLSTAATVASTTAAFQKIIDETSQNGIPWPGGESRIPWRTSQMLYFVESSDLTVEGITLDNSPYWSCFFHGCKNVAVRNLRVRTRRVPYHAHNGDGIDIDCCEDVEVSGCDINTADDCIAIRAYQSPLLSPRPDSPIGKIVLDNVNLPHGVVCLNTPDVRIVGGEFSLIESPFEEKQSMNRKIAEKNVFPCVFKGELYRSIQSRRKKFAR